MKRPRLATLAATLAITSGCGTSTEAPPTAAAPRPAERLARATTDRPRERPAPDPRGIGDAFREELNASADEVRLEAREAVQGFRQGVSDHTEQVKSRARARARETAKGIEEDLRDATAELKEEVGESAIELEEKAFDAIFGPIEESTRP